MESNETFISHFVKRLKYSFKCMKETSSLMETWRNLLGKEEMGRTLKINF